MRNITWLPQRDNFVEGTDNGWRFFILMKDQEDKKVPYSLCIITPSFKKEKVMAEDWGAETLEKMKWVAENISL